MHIGEGATAPVIAGLAAGITFVILIAYVFNSSSAYYENISIKGLKPIYHIGENITFIEQITGYENDCAGYPDINIESIDHSHVIFTTYDRNGPVPSCGDNFESNMPHTINKVYKSQQASPFPIIADKAGNYIFTASYADGKVEKEFIIVTDNQQQKNIEGVYTGIERQENNTTITINNEQYYMTTLSSIGGGIGQIPRGAAFTFHNVTFTFPYGSLLTPGSIGTVFEIKYPDGSIEKFGKVGEGYGEMALGISTIPGAKVLIAETVLGAHQNPNAGVAIYNKGEQIKLLVSTS